MPAHLPVPGHEDYELKGISRTVAEIEWLLVILVLFYQVLEGPATESAGFVYLGVLAFSTFVIGFRYFNLLRADNRWKIAIETWAMIVFTGCSTTAAAWPARWSTSTSSSSSRAR